MTTLRDQALTVPPHQRLRGASADAPVAVLVDGAIATWPQPERDAVVRAAAGTARDAGATGPVTVVEGPITQVLTTLADLADECAATSRPLVLIRAGLEVSPVALLDLFDHPTRGTVTLVIDRDVDPDDDGTASGWPPIRRNESLGGLVESVRTAEHRVRRPTGVAPGALRVDGADVARASQLWRAAAARSWAGSAFGMVLIALTRGGVPVNSVPLLAFTAVNPAQRHAGGLGPGGRERRGLGQIGAGQGSPDDAAHVGPDRGDPWRLRMMAAVRPVDGFFSIFVVRKFSRAVTWRLLPTGVAPNTITVLSLGVGLLAALACLAGGWPLFIVAAVLLQVSLVLDCVDGEIARYTRRFSRLGAWLDVSGDRLKETGVYAALGAYSYRQGEDLWALAILTMGLVSYRHFVDYGFVVPRRLARGAASEAVLLPLDEPGEGEASSSSDAPAAGQAGRRSRTGRLGQLVDRADSTSANLGVHWAKKALHLPVAERYLVISLGLLTGRPVVVFGVLSALELIAVAYTTGGRILRSIGGRMPDLAELTEAAPAASGRGRGWGELDQQSDLGPLARLIARRPMTGRLAWAVPSTVFAIEAAVVLAVQHAVAPTDGGAAFLLIAAAAYRRYDIIYRTRDLGGPPPAWTSWATLGADGRVLLVVLVALLWPGAFTTVLIVIAAVIAVLVLVESSFAWIVHLRRAAAA